MKPETARHVGRWLEVLVFAGAVTLVVLVAGGLLSLWVGGGLALVRDVALVVAILLSAVATVLTRPKPLSRRTDEADEPTRPSSLVTRLARLVPGVDLPSPDGPSYRRPSLGVRLFAAGAALFAFALAPAVAPALLVAL